MATTKVQKLVIVESPAKAKTIEKFLGKNYKVVSSFGHVRDLPKSKMGIEIDKGYAPDYIVSKDKSKVVKDLKAAARNATEVILASDEDREGEAIAWHISELLDLNPKTTKRIVFHEITKEAILEAAQNPRDLDINVVDAQQARRILDRLVGYELSPLLWKKVRRGLSAGRVQSVAVRLIAERENEIKDHAEQRYFKLEANVDNGGEEFTVKLNRDVKDAAEAEKIVNSVASEKLKVDDLTTSPMTRNAPAPLTTSTLQQSASSTLGMSVKQTMMLAQRLYESGHITYMRTDSMNLSQTAKTAIKSLVESEFGPKYLGEGKFRAASKGAQEAHEAIRPTNFTKTVAGNDERQKKLYDLIRRRTIASQMSPAKLLKTEVSVKVGNEVLIGTGVSMLFDGFMAVDPKAGVKESILPNVKIGDNINLHEVTASEKLKNHPARFTEASLVRALEKRGIGRPSTYAPTISTIQDRGYVEKEDILGTEVDLITFKATSGTKAKKEVIKEMYGAERRKLAPTDIGMLVNDFLVKHFPKIVDYDFTAKVEQQFDDIAEGKIKWPVMIDEFYKPFHARLTEIDKTVKREDTGSIKELGLDPKTNKMIYARLGRYGPVIQLGMPDPKDKEDKPIFAPFPAGMKVDQMTLEIAMKMLTLPRVVGKDEKGEEIEANIGRFGPYIKRGKQYVSVGDEDVFDVDEKQARALLKDSDLAKKKSLLKEFEGSKIQVKTGRFGPYVTDGKLNASIPKAIDPDSVDLEKAQELLDKKAARAKK